MLGRLHAHMGDAVTAEGLLRSALAQMERAKDAGAAGGGASFQTLQALVNVRHEYAELLQNMSWNQRSRSADADHQRSMIAQLQAQKRTEHAYVNVQGDTDLYVPLSLLISLSHAPAPHIQKK